MNNCIKVENVKLSDGNLYSGEAIINKGITYPNGYGKKIIETGTVIGKFEKGILKGVAYYNQHNRMYMGYFDNNRLNGWGVMMDRGNMTFGVWKDSQLVTNLTEQVNWMLYEIRKQNYNKSWAHVYPKAGEVFLGIPGAHYDSCDSAYLGFHFQENGDVYLGGMFNLKKTGAFLKYCNDGHVKIGEWENGAQIKSFSVKELLDFNIGKDFSDDLFPIGNPERRKFNNVKIDTTINYFKV